MAYKLLGSVNLAKLSNVGILNIKGATSVKKCVVIPIEDNDIYVNIQTKKTADGREYVDRKFNLGIEIYARQKESDYGDTHYAKRSLSKDFIKSHSPEEVKAINDTFLGDFKPVEIPSSNQARDIDAGAPVEAENSGDDNLPF